MLKLSFKIRIIKFTKYLFMPTHLQWKIIIIKKLLIVLDRSISQTADLNKPNSASHMVLEVILMYVR